MTRRKELKNEIMKVIGEYSCSRNYIVQKLPNASLGSIGNALQDLISIGKLEYKVYSDDYRVYKATIP